MGAAGYLINQRKLYNPHFEKEIVDILDDFDSAFRYHSTLAEYEPSPIIELPALAKNIGLGRIFVKDEGKRFGTSAMKILGASYAVKKLFTAESDKLGICTATDGNHGRAIAWAARKNKIRAVVFVPNQTSQSRIKFIEDLGARVILSFGKYDQAVEDAKEYAKKNDFQLIQDTAWDSYMKTPSYITAGYYTQMHEISEQLDRLRNPRIDAVFIQSGVGSWPSAVVHFIRRYLRNDKIKIVCVEPIESDCIYESIKRTHVATTRKSQKTIMAGLNCGTPSLLAYEILQNGVDAFVVISDLYAIDAIKYLNAPLPDDPYIAAGESGAAGLGGLLAVMENNMLTELRSTLELNEESNIFLFNTENVTDPDLHSQIMSGNYDQGDL